MVATPIVGQGAGGGLQLSPSDKATWLQGEGGVKKTQRRLTLEEKAKVLEAIKIGVERGYGYGRIWKTLKASGMDVSKRTVEYWYYKKYRGKVGRRGEYLPRELRIRLYEEALKMRKAGLGYKRIRKRIEELHGVKLSPAVIADWCSGAHSPYNGARIPTIDHLKPSPELAYVIGVVAGDGWAVKTNARSGEYRVGARAKDIEFIEEFARCLGKVLGREPPRPVPVEDGLLLVYVRSRALYQLLQKPIDIDRIRRFIEHCEDCKRSFLRGFYDSEGSVDNEGKIRCLNTDTRLLRYVQKLLKLLGIETTGPKISARKGTLLFDKKLGEAYKKRKNVYYIYVKARDKLKFYKLVGFTIRRKQQRLEEYVRCHGLLEDEPPNQLFPNSLFHSIRSH